MDALVLQLEEEVFKCFLNFERGAAENRSDPTPDHRVGPRGCMWRCGPRPKDAKINLTSAAAKLLDV